MSINNISHNRYFLGFNCRFLLLFGAYNDIIETMCGTLRRGALYTAIEEIRTKRTRIFAIMWANRFLLEIQIIVK